MPFEYFCILHGGVMKIKQFLLFLSVFFCFCIGTLNLFAEDLKIETGKTEDVYFRGNNYICDDETVYDNVNIGAGTKVVLDSQWQYVFLSSASISTGTLTISTYTYRKDEIIATLSVANSGNITLNNGSELSLRNQYSLITSTQNVALEYQKDGVDSYGNEVVSLKDGKLSNDNTNGFVYNGYENGSVLGTATNADLFTGNIVFADGDTDTILTFQEASDEEVVVGTGLLPKAKETTETQLDVVKEEESPGAPTLDVATFSNDFTVNSNRAVFNVLDTKSRVIREVVLNGSLSGNGTVVKKGAGTLCALGDGTGLTGANTGYSWSIEEGGLVVKQQSNLGHGDIYIASQGYLEIIDDGVFENNINSSNGEIAIYGGSAGYSSNVELSGILSGGLTQIFLSGFSNLILSGENTVNDFSIEFDGRNNFMYVNDLSLASESVTAVNVASEKDKESSNFQLVIDQNYDAEYSGSLNGEMYVQKTGTGTLTLSGENTYTQGTYISEGSILMSNASSLGTGKILFDSGVRGDTTTYASVGVSSITTVGTIDLLNDIHIDKGAIINVYDNQQLSLYGNIESYDSRPGYYAELVKNGLGILEISESTSSVRKVNISTFTIEEGSFRLGKNIVLDSYFSLNGDDALLDISEGAGITKTININSGDLSIFNQANISSATVNFLNTSAANLSNLYVSTNTVLSTSTLTNQINVAKGLNFVNDYSLTAYANAFNFVSGSINTVIHKEGDGNFIFNVGSTTPYNLGELSVNDGQFSFASDVSGSSATINISTIVVDGGILALKQGTYLTSSQSEIEIKTGGIGIYDETSIDPAILLNFNGTDPNNLARLVVEKSGANLVSNIAISTGLIVQNEGALTLTGTSIVGSSGIFGKDGNGTMTIADTDDFNVGELRLLTGVMNINNSTITLNTASITGGTLNVRNDSVFNAATANIQNAVLRGFGEINGTVNANTNSVIRADGDVDNEIGTMTLGSINFNAGSTLRIDVNSSEQSDLIDVVNNVQIGDGANLYVNVIGDESEYADKKTYQIITAGNSLSILNPANIGIFNTELSNLRLISNLYRSGRSIFLSIYQAFSEYELPGATKNQQAMLDVLNSIHANYEDSMQDTLNKVDEAYLSGTAEFVNAMQDLSGMFYVNSFEASALLSKVNMVYNRLDNIGSTQHRIWGQAYTNNNSVSENNYNPKFENNVTGMIMGYDMLQEDDSLFGFSCFYGTGELKQLNDKADVSDFGANAYTVYNYDQFTVKGLAGIGIQNYDATRTLNFINGNTINTKYTVNVINIDAEGTYNYAINSYLMLKPFVGLNFAIVSNDSFQENSVYEQNLKIDAKSYTKSEVRAGVGLANNTASKFNWHVSAFVKQIVDGEKSTMTASFVNVPDEKFVIEGTELPKTSIDGNLGCSYDIGFNVNVFIDLSSNMGSGLNSQTGTVGALYRW